MLSRYESEERTKLSIENPCYYLFEMGVVDLSIAVAIRQGLYKTSFLLPSGVVGRKLIRKLKDYGYDVSCQESNDEMLFEVIVSWEKKGGNK